MSINDVSAQCANILGGSTAIDDVSAQCANILGGPQPSIMSSGGAMCKHTRGGPRPSMMSARNVQTYSGVHSHQ